MIDIPVIVTVAREDADILRARCGRRVYHERVRSEETPRTSCVRSARRFRICRSSRQAARADETILETIEAGANAITWTAPSNGEIFKHIMAAYRAGEAHP